VVGVNQEKSAGGVAGLGEAGDIGEDLAGGEEDVGDDDEGGPGTDGGDDAVYAVNRRIAGFD
jgi:hypothetical protein